MPNKGVLDQKWLENSDVFWRHVVNMHLLPAISSEKKDNLPFTIIHNYYKNSILHAV